MLPHFVQNLIDNINPMYWEKALQNTRKLSESDYSEECFNILMKTYGSCIAYSYRAGCHNGLTGRC